MAEGKRSEKKRSITREQFLFFETRVMASLLSAGLAPEAAVERVQAENLFQFPTERTVKNIAGTCLRRLEALGQPSLVTLLAEAPADVARQVNLYAIMRENRLVWDFMVTVVGEKYRQGDDRLSRADIRRFMLEQREQDEDVAAWSDRTVTKCEQVLRRILIECDYLDPPARSAGARVAKADAGSVRGGADSERAGAARADAEGAASSPGDLPSLSDAEQADGERLQAVLLDPALKEGILENGDREALAAFYDFT